MTKVRIHYPLVTVVMPVRNEALYIERSLGAVLAQNYPRDRIEIIVTDGMSDDDTIPRIFRLRDAGRVRLIANPRRIQSSGLNRAIEQASGDIIIRVDAHTIIAPDYVRRCVETLQATGAHGVGGRLNPVGQGRVAQAVAAASQSPFAVPSTYRTSSRAQYADSVYMGAYPRHVLERVGLFDERLAVNEDYELNYRIRQSGGRLYHSPDLCSTYHGRHDLPALARRYFRYGFGKPRVLRKHPHSARLRFMVAPILVVSALMGVLLSMFFSDIRQFWATGILTYGLACVGFSLPFARQVPLALVWVLPLTFLTIHCAWGFGFWCGLFHLLAKPGRANVS